MTLSDIPSRHEPVDLAWLGARELALRPLLRAVEHDLRSPLNAVKLNLTLLERTLGTASAGRWLRVVQEEVSSLEKLFELASWLEPADPQREVPAGPRDLCRRLRAAEPLLESLAGKRDRSWRLEAEPRIGDWAPGAGSALLATASAALDSAPEGSGSPVLLTVSGAGPSAALARLEGGGRPEPRLLETLWSPSGARVRASDHRIEIRIEASR
ncbi:MAG: histidine kinase dimerization/phospho-acceptor domain-containing protein [Acidobacteriota bacterium]